MGISDEIIQTLKNIYKKIKILSLPLLIGILQGSCLSPLLFLLFINDLLYTLEKITKELYAYADDLATLNNNNYQTKRVINKV